MNLGRRTSHIRKGRFSQNDFAKDVHLSFTGGQKWEQLRGWQRALRQDRHVQQADRRCLRGEAHLRNISVNL